MVRRVLAALVVTLLAAAEAEAITVNPNGVNVRSQGATTVFLTFGGLSGQVPAEAFWCGELVSAAPAVGLRCNPSTIFGSLPIRYDLSRTSGSAGFTDIMSIPASVARRAYQAAQNGDTSSFYYVRRFVRPGGGPDEYVAVTCRMAGGGARVPLSLTDVSLQTPDGAPVIFVKPGTPLPSFSAAITYTGTGRLKGRWEVVMPGEQPPSQEDLLTEATLPLERRGTQRHYAELARFNLFLPPTGRVVLPGPAPSRVPTDAEGAYLVLLRIEVSDDKEGDSSLTIAGAGSGVVHSGAVAGFPMPPLRYVVGAAETTATAARGLVLLSPADAAIVSTSAGVDFAWGEDRQAAVYRLEIRNVAGQLVHSALLPNGVLAYRAPVWLREKIVAGAGEWRVVAVDANGREVRASAWRLLRFGQPK
jgi:hypothetical protein